MTSSSLPAGAPPVDRLDVTATLRGKTILLIGTTGFVGKVALCMLLDRYPDVGKVYCLVRPGAGNTAEERFYKKVATSEAFRPLRARHGDGTEAFLRSKIVAIPGDMTLASRVFSLMTGVGVAMGAEPRFADIVMRYTAADAALVL